MPNYTYYCKKCDYNHHELRKFEERNKASTCPECGKKRCPMTYAQSRNRPGHRGGMLIQGVGLTPKFYGNEGTLTGIHNQFLKESIEDSKEAIDGRSGVSPYTTMEIKHEYWKDNGVAEPQNDAEKTTANHKRQQVVADASKNMESAERKDMKRRHGVKDVKKIKTKNSK